jgi:hypothetical protein
MLTTFSGMSVVMNRKAARAVNAFPATVTDVLPCLIVVTILCVYGTSASDGEGPRPGTDSRRRCVGEVGVVVVGEGCSG